jgi:hypothetical protein
LKNRVALGVVLVALVFAATHSIRAELPQTIGTWASLGATPESRVGAAAVALKDGRTLIAGGSVDSTPTDSVVVFDPNDGSFLTVGHLLAGRVGHTATLLDDGRVLIAGGTAGDLMSADLELFDPVAGVSVLGGAMVQPRTGHAAAKLADGKVLIVGGTSVDGVLRNAEVYDPETGTTTATLLPMLSPRTGASATTLIDGRVLVAGGNNGPGTPDLASAEIFEPSSQIFEATTTSLSFPRSGHAAVLLPNNNSVLIAGGSSNGIPVKTSDLFVPAEFPDPYSYGMGSFAQTGDLLTARARAIASSHIEGYAVAIGGGAPEAEVYRFPTIKTDKDDYAPGTKAIITGSGWERDSEVTLVFQEDPAVHDDYVLHVPTDGNGNFSWNQWAPEWHDLNVRFYLLAKDSHSRAQVTFSDSQPQTVSITPASVQVTQGATASYSVTVTKQGNNSACNITLAVTGLPTGANGTFIGGATFTMTNANVSKALDITTTSTGPMSDRTPSGTFTFTVTTQKDTNCQGGAGAGPSGHADLVVLDQSSPNAASVTVPANGSTFTAATVPATFSGTAADNTNGVGLAANSTTFTLQRPDSTYWNGSTWQALAFPLSTIHAATTSGTVVTWSRSTGMPVWASQPVGIYTVRATATDESGNSFSGAAITFVLQAAGPTKLAFANSAFSGAVNSCFGPFGVQSQDSSNVATNVTTNTTVNLSTDQSGTFYSDVSCLSSIANRTIASGSSSTGNFYYKPTAVGSGAHTLTAADAATVLTSATQVQTVTKADQTIIFNALGNKTYGDADFTVSATASSGLTVSFSSQTSTTCSVSGATVHIVAEGTCTIRASQAGNTEYNAAPNVDRSFTVNKLPVTVTTNDASKTYGEADPSPLTTADASGFLAGDHITASFSRVAGENVGPYHITTTLNDPNSKLGNYTVTNAGATFTINQAILTVVADDKTKVFNAPLPALTHHFTGFKNGDTASVVSGNPNLSTPATVTSPVGTYPISASLGSLGASNYSFTFASGTLSIVYLSTGSCLGQPGHQILQPINVDGTSVIKKGSTVPAKFRVCDAAGNSVGVPGVVTSFKLVQIISGTVTNANEDVTSTTPDTAFRWDSTDKQWIFNISTKVLNANQTYVYEITLNDGSTISFRFGVR